MPLPIRIDAFQVFPNSGHHLKFIALMPTPDGTQEQVLRRMPELRERQASMTDELRQKLTERCKGRPEAWKSKDDRPWFRWRFGSQTRTLADGFRATLLGVWVAVESNLGALSRGYLTRFSKPPTQAEHDAYAAETAKPIKSPYAAENFDAIDPAAQAGSIVVRLDQDPICQIPFQWVRPDGLNPIEVDLVIDFGNTRTAVLALEHIGEAQQNLSAICRPIPFYERDVLFEGQQGFVFDEEATLVDSWFLLHEPRFAGSEGGPGEIRDWQLSKQEKASGFGPFKRVEATLALENVFYRIPQMFVELSPALMGASAKEELLNVDLRQGGNYCLSSPKRYAWDTDMLEGPGDSNWHMRLNPWRSSPSGSSVVGIPNLEGEMLRFMPADGRDWSLDSPPATWPQQQRPSERPTNPRYPRSDTLTWTALSIVENAYRTIMSEAWRASNRPFGRRRLRQVIVTYPAGWTAKEIEAYRTKWQKALNIFGHAHMQNWQQVPAGETPQLVMTVDEAVASQLPIIHAEMQRMGNIGCNWLEIVGHGSKTSAKARVMTVDIGGGTTDVSVVEYQDMQEGVGVDLHATVLFKDSSTIAGDHLRKLIIERVLLPITLGGKAGVDRDAVARLFGGAQSDMAGYARWSRITRILLLPIINRWLADLASNRTDDFTLTDLFRTGMEEQVLAEFNAESERIVGAPLLSVADSLKPPVEALRQCVAACFDSPFVALAKHIAAFECDLAIVTGKPSELPEIRRLLEEHLPLAPNRLIFARGYPAGSSWPLSADGRINDAKLVTVVGAALYQAIQTNHIKDWHISIMPAKELLTRNWWGAMPQRGTHFRPVYLEPDENEKSVSMMVGTQIGRKLLPGEAAPEPIYLLRWRDPQLRLLGPAPSMTVTLRRVAPAAAGEAESLEIVSATGTLKMTGPDGLMQSRPISEKDVELKLCTLKHGERYWLDTGRFEVQWPESEGRPA
jgi:hypothetical protein